MSVSKSKKITNRLASISASSAAVGAPAEKKRKFIDRIERPVSYKFGRVIMQKNVQVQCIVNNINKLGAQITLEREYDLPSRILLKIDQTGTRYRARVVWRDEERVGVEFMS